MNDINNETEQINSNDTDMDISNVNNLDTQQKTKTIYNDLIEEVIESTTDPNDKLRSYLIKAVFAIVAVATAYGLKYFLG